MPISICYLWWGPFGARIGIAIPTNPHNAVINITASAPIVRWLICLISLCTKNNKFPNENFENLFFCWCCVLISPSGWMKIAVVKYLTENRSVQLRMTLIYQMKYGAFTMIQWMCGFFLFNFLNDFRGSRCNTNTAALLI